MEAMYQYVWKHRMIPRQGRLKDGREVRIVTPGVLNTDAGPDFSFAKVEIDGREWSGNIEIHERSSDWFRHGHERDAAYDNVVLHVVADADCEVSTKSGRVLPQFEIQLPEGFAKSYEAVAGGLEAPLCHRYIKLLDPLRVTDWLETLSVERLQSKASHVAHICEETGGDWQQACFAILARALGLGLNSEPMEMAARRLPLNFARRHSDNQLQLDALVFGVAGMLDPSIHIFDEYYQALCSEFYFLARKYGLQPMYSVGWKYACTRPQNFPHRRLAMLARVLKGGFSLMSDMLDCGADLQRHEELYDLTLDGYWQEHFGFGDEARQSAPSSLSLQTRQLLIINATVPFMYAYGSTRGDYECRENAVSLLEELPAEKNRIVRSWMDAGLKGENAMRSQALLFLKKSYCDSYRCTECRFGHEFLKQASKYWNGEEQLTHREL